MSALETNREQYAHFYETAVKQAQGGDRQMAEHLISAFAELADDPHVFDSVGGNSRQPFRGRRRTHRLREKGK